MRGNTNANISGGGSGNIKILNVVQTGTLYRNGAKFGGFDGSNYLTLGARVDNGILSVDNNTSYKNILELSQADDWEFVIKFKTPDTFVKQGITYYGWTLWYQAENQWTLYIDRTAKLTLYINGIYAVSENSLVEDTVYYIKLKYSYSESTYKLYLSTTGEFNGEETLEITINDQTKIPNKIIIFGRYETSNDYSYTTTVGYIDMEGTYIKINGEYWWKGVETLTI